MKYLQNNLNLALLFLFIIVLISFAGFSAFYQHTYANLTNNYQSKIDHLDEVTRSLQSEKSLLNQTSYELEIKQARESNLQGQYADLRNTNEKLKADLDLLRNDFNTKVAQLLKAQKDLTELDAKIKGATIVFNRRIDVCQSDLGFCRHDLEVCQTSN